MIYKKLMTTVVLGVVFFQVNVSPIHAAGSEVTISSLLSVVSLLSQSVNNSTEITDAERMAFLSRLSLLVQNLTLILNKYGDITLASGSSGNPSTSAINRGTIAADSVGLKQVIFRFNPDTFKADVKLQYTNNSSNYSYDLVKNPSIIEFDKIVSGVKNQVLALLVEETDILKDDLKDRMLFSTKNPAKDLLTAASLNKAEARSVADKVGFYSIVNQIWIEPGTNFDRSYDDPKFTLITDQNERIISSVLKDRDDDTNFVKNTGTHEYLAELFVAKSNGQQLKIMSESDAANIDGMVLEMTRIFQDTPVSKTTSNYANKLVNFVVLNPIYYQVRHQNEPKIDCYTASDKAKFLEYIKSYLEYHDMQYIDNLPAITGFFAPLVVYSDDSFALPECKNVTNLF